MNGIERVRRAIAQAGGYEWCEEHNIYRWWGPSNCSSRHDDGPCYHRVDEDGTCRCGFIYHYYAMPEFDS